MDKKFMKRVLELARRAEGLTSPNPAVGAVIVKGGKIIGEGWHKKCGGDHAEIVSMKNALGKSPIISLKGAEMYVTLEPCCHEGKTGPCVAALVEAGIKKVYIGMKDPSEKVNGKGIKFLKKHGVEVKILDQKTELANDIKFLNRFFVKWEQSSLPYVILKAGMSLNGKIARHHGKKSAITSKKAREDAYIERSKCDAVIVGKNTVMIDNPELSAHGKWAKKGVLRVIMDGHLWVNPKAKVFRDENVLIACTDLANETTLQRFLNKGIDVVSFGKNTVSAKRLLKYLGECGVQSVFVEGGTITHRSFFKEADEILLYMSPEIIKTKDAVDVFDGVQVNKPNLPKGFDNVSTEKIGEDLKIRIWKN